MANSDSIVMVKTVAGLGSWASRAAVSGCSKARSNSAIGPPNRTNVTNRPTAMKATSLTIDSVAIARINPS